MIQIDVLPDDVLLEIFDFYAKECPLPERRNAEAWQPLVHVCRRWRNLVFESPRRLNLRLYCSPEIPTRDTLQVWPALPLLVCCRNEVALSESGMDNIVAALGQSNRVCKVDLFFRWELKAVLEDVLQSEDVLEDVLQLEDVLPAMEVPFPELTFLRLVSIGQRTPPVLSDSFLGGFAPRLQILRLDNIPFPGLPKLLLSATHLLRLHLYGLSRPGYISPQAMIALLSALSTLEVLSIEFQSPQFRLGRESPSLPPPKRAILPALRIFRYEGITEYLEELVAHIDAPQLGQLDITFFDQIDFGTPRLTQFIDCATKLRQWTVLVRERAFPY